MIKIRHAIAGDVMEQDQSLPDETDDTSGFFLKTDMLLSAHRSVKSPDTHIRSSSDKTDRQDL
jgi:hypothetical protein